MPDPDLTPGQSPPKHEFWRDLDREVYQKTEAAKPLLITQKPDGRKLDLHLPLKLTAKITGRTGTAYSWSEVINAGSSWTVLTGGRTGSLNAYELNGSTTVPTNAIVELRYSSAGDWRFEKMGIGTPAPTCWTCVRIQGCVGPLLVSSTNLYLEGVTVTVTGPGGFTVTADTDADGKICFEAPASGTYNVSATVPGWNNISASFSRTCPSADSTRTFTTTPPTGFHCGCCPVLPHPDTLYLTDKYGTHTLTWGVMSANNWSATVNVYESEAGEICPTPCNSRRMINTAANVPITYVLRCSTASGVTTWSLEKTVRAYLSYYQVCSGGLASFFGRMIGGTLPVLCTNDSVTTVSVVDDCTPISLSFTVPTMTTVYLGDSASITGSGDTVTVSE